MRQDQERNQFVGHRDAFAQKESASMKSNELIHAYWKRLAPVNPRREDHGKLKPWGANKIPIKQQRKGESAFVLRHLNLPCWDLVNARKRTGNPSKTRKPRRLQENAGNYPKSYFTPAWSEPRKPAKHSQNRTKISRKSTPRRQRMH